jgi:cyclohexanecarboxyl-CoA dehydrogenase
LHGTLSIIFEIRSKKEEIKMAGFGFTEEQEMIRRSVREFGEKELAPGADERAKSHDLPLNLVKKMAELGFLGISVPEKYGGQGADWISLGIVVEELCKVDLTMGMTLITPSLGFLCLEQASEDVKEEWLPALVSGEKICCFAVTEPDVGSDVAAMKATAVREGDYYVLNGEKTSITLGMHADASIVFAKTDPDAGARGVTCFWLPLGLEGVSRELIVHSGMKGAACASFFLDNVHLESQYRVGEEGKGFYIFAASGADYLRVCLSLAALGLAESSMEETMKYVSERNAFGRPIVGFEGVSFKIAEHSTRIEAAKLLCYRTLYLKDQGLPHTKESAMCKWLCPEVAFNAIHDCVLLHGHLGYSEEYPLEQRLRDVLGLEFADGTAQIMKIVVTRELVGRISVPYKKTL